MFGLSYRISRLRLTLVAQVLSNSNGSVSIVQDLATPHLGFIRNATMLFPMSVKLFSSGDEQFQMEQPKECSFAVSYLINSCGLSQETAKSVAKRVKLRSPKRPDSVLKLLKNYGFSDNQIAKIVKGNPNLLVFHPERRLLPKLEFLKSIGVTNAELADACSSNPAILCQSLENQLIPNYNFLKSVLLSDENVVRAFRGKSRTFSYDLQKNVSPKLAVLQELGMPKSIFSLILTCYAPVILQRRDKFDENIKKVIELGFDPKKCGFVHAMQVFASFTESKREHKLDVLRSWGWSDNDIWSAFKKCPCFMNASEKKIISGLDFLVNKMGWQSTAVAAYPIVFLMNMEKRTIPRCLVIKVLQLKGLVNKNLSLGQVLRPVENIFFDKFVAKHMDDIPHWVSIYQRKEGLESLGLNNCVSSSLSTSKS